MKKYFDVLRRCSLFNGIHDDNLITMLSCLGAKAEAFPKKHTIITEGNPASSMGIVLSGSVCVEQIDYYGNRTILSKLAPGELFAEAFACAEVPSIPVSVIANEACEVMLIDACRIMHSCSNACDFHRQIIFNLMKNLALKNIMFHQKIEITSKRSTREKLMTYLLLKAKECGSSCFDIPFNRQELADYLEVDRSGLSAEISKLRSEGIIESTKSRFKLI